MVGVVVGSVLDGQIADSLRDRLEGVEQSLDDTVDSIDAKNAELELQQRYMEESAPYVVQGTVAESATLVVAETGLDGAAVEDLVRRLRQGGSRVEGVVWLDRRMDLSERADRDLVAGLIGAPGSTSATDLRVALWDSVIGSAAVTPPGDGVPAEEPVVPLLFQQAPLADLAEAGLIRLQTLDGGSDQPATTFQVAAVTGPRATTSSPGVLIGEVASAAAGSGVPALVAELHPSGTGSADREGRGDLLVLADGGDAVEIPTISTVDDLELLAGRVAGVLALSDLQEGRSGRYGLGPEVDGLIPPWQGP